jgi:hypothetical protein
MVESRQEHRVAAKHVLKYLRGTMVYDLRYLGDGEVKLQGYTNSDWATNATDRKSTSARCFNLGSAMISWFNRKKTYVAFSLAYVEYMAASTTSCDANFEKCSSFSKNFLHRFQNCERAGSGSSDISLVTTSEKWSLILFCNSLRIK